MCDVRKLKKKSSRTFILNKQSKISCPLETSQGFLNMLDSLLNNYSFYLRTASSQTFNPCPQWRSNPPNKLLSTGLYVRPWRKGEVIGCANKCGTSHAHSVNTIPESHDKPDHTMRSFCVSNVVCPLWRPCWNSVPQWRNTQKWWSFGKCLGDGS